MTTQIESLDTNKSRLIFNSEGPKDRKFLKQLRDQLTDAEHKFGSLSVHNKIVTLVVTISK